MRVSVCPCSHTSVRTAVGSAPCCTCVCGTSPMHTRVAHAWVRICVGHGRAMGQDEPPRLPCPPPCSLCHPQRPGHILGVTTPGHPCPGTQGPAWHGVGGVWDPPEQGAAPPLPESPAGCGCERQVRAGEGCLEFVSRSRERQEQILIINNPAGWRLRRCRERGGEQASPRGKVGTGGIRAPTGAGEGVLCLRSLTQS